MCTSKKKTGVISAIIFICLVAVVAVGIGIFKVNYGKIVGTINITADTSGNIRIDNVKCISVDYGYKQSKVKTRINGGTVSFSNIAKYGLYSYTIEMVIDDITVPIYVDFVKASNRGKSQFTIDVKIENVQGVYNAVIDSEDTYDKHIEVKDIEANQILITAGEV